jgi:hypothetical protein
MKTSELISKLQRQLKNHGDLEARKGIYNGQTECFDGVYFDEDDNTIVIH